MNSPVSSSPTAIKLADALAMLPDGDHIHTMCAARGIALGADWTREAVIKALENARVIYRATGYSREIGHGLVIVHNGTPTAIQTKPAIGESNAPDES